MPPSKFERFRRVAKDDDLGGVVEVRGLVSAVILIGRLIVRSKFRTIAGSISILEDDRSEG